MSEKASYSQESEFSYVAYPYVFKFVLAPFLDLFYSNTFGKNKSYIVPTGIILSIIPFILASRIENWILDKKIGEVTLFWFFEMVILTVYQIACEAWVFTLFSQENKSKASVARVGGALLGGFISYNLFIPLNSVEFLNKYIFGHDPIKKPLVSHYELLMFLSFFTLVLTLYIWIFIEEKMITRNANLSIGKMWRYTKNLFTHSCWVQYYAYILLSESAVVLIRDSITLKLIQNGIEKAELATLETPTVLFRFLFCFVVSYFIASHQNLKRYHFAKIYNMLTYIFLFYTLKHLISSKNKRLALEEILTFNILKIFSVVENVLIFAFLNDKIDEEMGATGITIMLCIGNFSNIVPKTIGYQIVGVIKDYEGYAVSCFILSIIGYVVTWYYAVILDAYEVEKYEIFF